MVLTMALELCTTLRLLGKDMKTPLSEGYAIPIESQEAGDVPRSEVG